MQLISLYRACPRTHEDNGGSNGKIHKEDNFMMIRYCFMGGLHLVIGVLNDFLCQILLFIWLAVDHSV
jgi:hypothetical protein